MEMKAYLANQVSQMLFLDVKKEKIEELFHVQVKENIYLPIRSSRMVENVEHGKGEEIPIAFFIEGMFFVMGADENFKYNILYKEMILQNEEYKNAVKGIIFKEVKNEKYEDAYVLLRGLLSIEETKENYNKAFMLLESLRTKEKMYGEEELDIVEKSKNIVGYAEPYLYEAILKKEKGEYEQSLDALEQYFLKGGSRNEELDVLQSAIRNSADFEKGKALLYTEPTSALKLLIPLLEVFEEEASLYYYVAVGYRILKNHEKAIYYLNHALSIDSALVEVVNELGINYASLGQYQTAVEYLRKAFEATKAIEICTNLVMCYMQLGDMHQAKLHLEIAKRLSPEDEIVEELERALK